MKIKLIYILLAFLFFSCQHEKKSELVQRLEGIFYNDSFASIPETDFNVADYGALADGKTLATEAIQKTIDAASTAGGGRVIFPDGTYLSGALFVKSNVELHIGEGVVIQAIQDNDHFPRLATRIAGIEMEWPAALINVYDEKNVRITGKGTIDGNGKYWWDKFWGDPPRSGGMYPEYIEKGIRWAVDYDCERVRPVVVWESEDVLLKDFTVQRAGFWTVSLTYSTRVHVDGVVVQNNIGGHGPSSDGIDTDSSKDVLVENCDIDCNDDNLCIKAGKDADGLRVNRPAENIVYRNCITRSGHGLITLGSETSGGMRNIEVYGLEAVGTNIGIRFKSAKVRGGLIENIYFHDIKMKDVANPFHFELNWYPEYSYCTIPDNIPEEEIKDRWRVLSQRVEPEELGIPEFRNITLSDIKVVNAKEAFYANAYPEKPIHNINWNDILIEAEHSGKLTYASNWKMNNVLLKTTTGKPIELVDCENIEQPQIVKTENQLTEKPELSIEQQIKNVGAAIVPVNPSTGQVIANGDTTLFSEKITVYIVANENSDLTYYEPLGDGFYHTPVHISVKDAASVIELNGEREHEYAIILYSDNSPENIDNADSWEFDAGNKQVIIKKKGNSFNLTIH
ncbi:glycoside hydrolase family 28 protein [Draconibacterium sp. IB214405]|uniref:glycoside hydrolase family 28 protein n=1 Tax=Draconibacterium sp. IB214405 TaxID=3097352 RepID=UPI002A110D40|nr:glycoside hydrolase family 28 protein [Draconibacterium sp. IB214405]MDX8339382.1 glycoside hydrolase family 28 protein [Draconibacterium sp. IB214405]